MRKQPKTIAYNPVVDPARAHGYKNARWVENVSHGLRLVGFADDIIAHCDHNGWHTEDDCDGDIYRGVVYQLPSRAGETLYAYGYADPCNDDCAFLCFDLETDKEEAARQADRFAELFAEEQRDYNRAWRAGRDCEQLADDIKQARKEALTIAEEMRQAKRANVQAPTICATLRAKLIGLYEDIQEARRKRDKLIDSFGTCPGFVE